MALKFNVNPTKPPTLPTMAEEMGVSIAEQLSKEAGFDIGTTGEGEKRMLRLVTPKGEGEFSGECELRACRDPSEEASRCEM